jgi:hypothetical protein
VFGSIRYAEPDDDAELARLFIAHLEATPPRFERDRGHLLVFELDGVLRAAAHVVLDARCARARVHLLVVDGALGTAVREVEDRLRGVARALCEAYGCVGVETERDEEDRAALHAELEASIAEADTGRTEDFAAVLAELRQAR